MIDQAPLRITLPHVIFLSIILLSCLLLPYLLNTLQSSLTRVSLHLKRRRSSISQKILPLLEESPLVVSRGADFPDDWWTSERIYQLERRAIFSKTWLHVCHASLLPKPGDFRTFSFADFAFILIRGKDGQLRAFHNVCRHRAYNVTDKTSGNAGVLMCKYHAWTYDNRGKLVKAPKFEDVAGFDKSQNGLFSIRTFIDSSGFVYANFDVYGSDGLTIRVGVPIRAQLRLIETWSENAEFNWKIAVPPGAFHVQSLALVSRFGDLLSKVLRIIESWTWPSEIELSTLTRGLRSKTGDQWLTISIVPISQSKTSIRCAFYTSGADSKRVLPLVQIKQEVHESIRALEAAFSRARSGNSVPDLASQEPLLAEINAHSRLEKLVRHEVHPASRLRESSNACQVADDLCRELEAAEGSTCTGESLDRLAW